MTIDSLLEETLLPKLFSIMEEIFEIEPGTLNIDSDHENVDGWDSLKMVHIAVAIEEQFQISLTPDEVVEMISVRRIVEILRQRA